MWKWLRSWFAWRFSLGRLVVATVFLGAVVGLNLRTIGPMDMGDYFGSYWGWPYPFGGRSAHLEYVAYCTRSDMDEWSPDTRKAKEEEWAAYCGAARSYQLPWTHQTYRTLEGYAPSGFAFIGAGALDALVAIIPLFLILFLQIPRRKVAAKGE